jgi:hypothetical protein
MLALVVSPRWVFVSWLEKTGTEIALNQIEPS